MDEEGASVQQKPTSNGTNHQSRPAHSFFHRLQSCVERETSAGMKMCENSRQSLESSVLGRIRFGG